MKTTLGQGKKASLPGFAMKSLQMKLTVMILILFLVALGSLGGLNYWKARQVISENITKDMSEMAVTSAGNVGDWLNARMDEMTVMSVAPVVQSGDKEAIRPFLANVAKAKGLYASIGFASPDGTFLNSAGAVGSIGDRAYFGKVMQGQSAIVDPSVSKATGLLVVTLAVPVKADNKVIGVLYSTVDMADLTKKVLAIKVGQTGYASVIQGDGLRIIHPDKEQAMKGNPLTAADADAKEKAAASQMIKGEKGITVVSAKGVDKYYAFAPIPGVNWSLAVEVPVREVTGIVSGLTTITTVTTVIVMFLAALALMVITRQIVGPLSRMVGAIQEVAAGDLSERQQTIKTADEIGQLANAIVIMRDNLRGLVKRVRGATEQVAASAEELTASADQSAQAANQIAGVIGEVAAGRKTR